MTSRYIEKSFPIVQLNPLSQRERNAFKPVYKMHKWFARRSSSIFRAILLGAALPAEEDGAPLDLMAEFYKGHGDDPRLKRPDGKPLRVLDPFMGGGTTIVEALRLGFDVVGVDYNPIAWFIVRGETTPVDLDQLDMAFQRVADKVKDELLGLYKTRCPLTGRDADIIYGFWVKQGVCTDPLCGGVTDLFKDYEVARKRGDASIAYIPDVVCPYCSEEFDWELDRCTVTAGGPQVLGDGAAGKKRPHTTRFAFGVSTRGVDCPHCGGSVPASAIGPRKPKKKTVQLHVLLDSSTGDFFEVRGGIPDEVVAPVSGHRFAPKSGPAKGGKFSCQECGRTQAMVDAARAHGKPLPFRCYGYYAVTPHADDEKAGAIALGLLTNNNKWFGAVSAEDLQRIEDAAEELERIRSSLPLPEQEIYDGYNTNRLVIHQYKRWSELYGPRQLLALGKLLRAIGEEPDAVLRDALLGAFQSHLDNASNLCAFDVSRNMLQRVTAAHDFRNPTTISENNVWGVGGGIGRGPFENCVLKYRDGCSYRMTPDLFNEDGPLLVDDVTPAGWKQHLSCGSSSDLGAIGDASVDVVITDPPYAGSVQYAEMSDWSYVWLHHVLKDHYPDEFGSEITLKSEEIIEDGSHKDADFFFNHLAQAWRECRRVLVDDGLLVFTFHHKEGDRWTGLLKSLFEAGFYLVAAYPTHSEALNSIVIQATKGITYDIVHVCRKRLGDPESIPWSVLRREVQRDARAQLRELEEGGDVLPGPDVWMILLGSALHRFSQHYGKVLDHDGTVLDLNIAIERLKVLIHELRGETLPLPAALTDADGLTQVYLLHLVGNESGWTRDGLHIELRGYEHTPDRLASAGLIEQDPKESGRWILTPALKRAEQIDGRTHPYLIDSLHYFLGIAHRGEDLRAELLANKRRGLVAEGLAYLAKRDATLRELCALVLRAIEDVGTKEEVGQLSLLE
ncbi:MAG: DUF1156 domain-containing protein [Sandaracinaceae bacterium]|nr:DUF1156 domain-containing protein [Sandaracinaceae bacterium]